MQGDGTVVKANLEAKDKEMLNANTKTKQVLKLRSISIRDALPEVGRY
jgi:hypothetical protein